MNWRKSKHSFSNGNCTEVANQGRMIAVRDSADLGGPVLAFTSASWAAFTQAIKSS